MVILFCSFFLSRVKCHLKIYILQTNQFLPPTTTTTTTKIQKRRWRDWERMTSLTNLLQLTWLWMKTKASYSIDHPMITPTQRNELSFITVIYKILWNYLLLNIKIKNHLWMLLVRLSSVCKGIKNISCGCSWKMIVRTHRPVTSYYNSLIKL